MANFKSAVLAPVGPRTSASVYPIHGNTYPTMCGLGVYVECARLDVSSCPSCGAHTYNNTNGSGDCPSDAHTNATVAVQTVSCTQSTAGRFVQTTTPRDTRKRLEKQIRHRGPHAFGCVSLERNSTRISIGGSVLHLRGKLRVLCIDHALNMGFAVNRCLR